MAKQKITEVVEAMLADFMAEAGLELYNSEFIKEGKDWFLRVYIDKPEEQGYIDTEDCEKVSRYLSERLDEEDPIDKEYYLEVSSPGMDRVLVKPEHYARYVGKEVEVKLYKGKDGTKNIQGTLTACQYAKIDADELCENAQPCKSEQAGGGAQDAQCTGQLVGIIVTDEKGKEWNLTMEEIAKTRLAVIF